MSLPLFCSVVIERNIVLLNNEFTLVCSVVMERNNVLLNNEFTLVL